MSPVTSSDFCTVKPSCNRNPLPLDPSACSQVAVTDAVRDMFSGHWSYNFNSLQYVWTSQSHQVHGGSKGVVSTSACAQFGLNIRRQVDEPVEATRGHPCPWDTDPGVRPGNDAGSSSILSSVDIALSSI